MTDLHPVFGGEIIFFFSIVMVQNEVDRSFSILLVEFILKGERDITLTMDPSE